MNLHDLVSQLIVDTKGDPAAGIFSAPTRDSSLWAFLPELILCATILLMLLIRLFRGGHRVNAGYIALAGTLVALVYAAPWQHLAGVLTADAASAPAAVTRMEIFTGMLVYDTFSVYLRSVLLLFVVLFVIFTRISGIPDREDGPDIYTLVLGSTLGMCLMATANHLLMVFLAVEMASVPSYVLAGLQKGKRKASEAALKYSIYGAGTAGVMLYGISLLAGLLNTAHLPTIALRLADKLQQQSLHGSELLVLAFAGLTIGVGLAFKLSAVPFHFWCPDVFEGATAEVNAFLSVASKAAALGLLLRVVLGVGTVAPEGVAPGARSLAAIEKGGETRRSEFRVPSSEFQVLATSAALNSEPETRNAELSTVAASRQQALAPIRSFIAKLVAFFAIITCTFGNLAAYGQNNLKRLLAYSTIAHAGYMMMPVAAVIALVGLDTAGAQAAVAALAIYIAVYLFMNLGAFAVVAFLRNAMRSEEIPDYAGLIRRAPLTVICFSVILFALIGLPPLSGFIGKFAVFAALVDAYQRVQSAGQSGGYLLLTLVVGGLNTAVSLFYYLRVVKVMTIDEEPRERLPLAWSDVSLAGAFLWLITLPTAVLMVNWNGLSDMAHAAARYLFS